MNTSTDINDFEFQILMGEIFAIYQISLIRKNMHMLPHFKILGMLPQHSSTVVQQL